MVAKTAIDLLRRICAAILFFTLPGTVVAVPAVVDYIIDGDTFAARVNMEPDIFITVRVRIANVDTPELHGQCDYEINMAKLAQARLAQLIPIGTNIELGEIRDDKYLGRIDARVFGPDGRDIGRILINEKLGRPYDGGRRGSWCK